MADHAGGVLVLGATRETGLEVVQLLHNQGKPVTGFARPESDKSDLQAVGVPIALGDAFDRATIDAALGQASFDAIVSSLGGHFRDERRVDFEGNKNAVDAAKSAGVKRFIMITLIGCGDSLEALSPEAQKIFAKAIELKTKAEKTLIESGLDYTILRPGGMRSEPATGRGLLSEDRSMMGVIHRADLAALIVKCLEDDSTIGRIYATVDSEMTGMPELQIPFAKSNKED